MFTRIQKNTSNLRPLLVGAVARTLLQIFAEHKFADKVIETALRSNPKAGSRDRAFIAETTYDVVRNYRLYAEILGKTAETETDFWQITGIHFLLKGETLPDWREYQTLNVDHIRQKAAELRQNFAILVGLPDWLDALGRAELGERWEATARALNEPARVVLRANRLKTDRQALQKALEAEDIHTESAGDTDALLLRERRNIFQTAAFKNGLFEVQDYSSQQVAPLLAPEPGMRVVDACAGGGGKTLHLAALMQGRGQIIAMDTTGWKLDELRRRARRAGASNIETRVIESRKTIKRLYGTADRLLLDVPCSGLGVLRRNPDSKWKLQPEIIAQLRKDQQEILRSYSPIVKPGGKLLYATCSILPSENDRQVAEFLATPEGKHFRLVEERRILPQDEGFDGFYLALLERIPNTQA